MKKEIIKNSKQLCNIFIDSHHYISVAIDREKIPKLMVGDKKLVKKMK